MIIVKYFSYRTGKLIREDKYADTTYNRVMARLYPIEHKYIISNNKDEIEVYL